MRTVGRNIHNVALTRRHFCGGLGAAAGTAAMGYPLPSFARQTSRFDLAAYPDFVPLVEAAEKEGSATLLTNLIYEGSKSLPKLFNEYYGLPDTYKLNIINKGGAQVSKQIQEEIEADKVSADVVLFNLFANTEKLAAQGEILEFETPQDAAYSSLDKLGFNRRGLWVSDLFYVANIAWNKDQYGDRQFASWNDLLSPDLDGKISFVNARLSSSMALCYKAMRDRPEIGKKFFVELAKLKPTPFQRANQCLEMIASGEFPVTMIGSNRAYSMKKDLGVNVGQSFPREGVAPIPCPNFAMKRSKRPASAKLLLNFIRSSVAQAELANGEGWTTGRNDVVSPNPSFVPPLDKVKILPVDIRASEQELLAIGREWESIFGA